MWTPLPIRYHKPSTSQLAWLSDMPALKRVALNAVNLDTTSPNSVPLSPLTNNLYPPHPIPPTPAAQQAHDLHHLNAHTL